eukprot:scaffold75006_cov36-Tisochrysis_lutea.AAC.7
MKKKLKILGYTPTMLRYPLHCPDNALLFPSSISSPAPLPPSFLFLSASVRGPGSGPGAGALPLPRA